MGIPAGIAIALMGVLVASFAGTTLDTACRLQRYVVQELARCLRPAPAPGPRRAPIVWCNPLAWLANKHGATLFAVTVGALMAAMPVSGNDWSWENAGKGGLILWPMFGATNQLLGGLAFMVITFYLWRRGKAVWFVALPLVFMLVMPAWAMLWLIFVADGSQAGWAFQDAPNWVLIFIALATLALEAWMLVEAALLFPKVRGLAEDVE